MTPARYDILTAVCLNKPFTKTFVLPGHFIFREDGGATLRASPAGSEVHVSVWTQQGWRMAVKLNLLEDAEHLYSQLADISELFKVPK